MSAMEATVHIVDDDASYRQALGRLVETYGFCACSYESGEDFLARLPKSGTGCILLDLQMPGLSGLELQVRIAQAVPLLPIVYLTGQGTIAASVNAMKAGADDFLEKPVASETLRQAIARALTQSEERRSASDQMQMLETKISKLTPRETQVFDFVVRGKRNKQIAFELNTSERTVKAHRHSVMEKLGAGSFAEIVSIAERLGRTGPTPSVSSPPSATSPKANMQGRKLGSNSLHQKGTLRTLGGEQKLQSSPRTVAIVEDDPSMRRSIERSLNANGFQTQSYDSAETFLAKGAAGVIGCLVLDIHLGKMSGIQLRSELRDIHATLPVIFITAVDDEALEAEARYAGCVAYLRKPFPAKLLLTAIDEALL